MTWHTCAEGHEPVEWATDDPCWLCGGEGDQRPSGGIYLPTTDRTDLESGRWEAPA